MLEQVALGLANPPTGVLVIEVLAEPDDGSGAVDRRAVDRVIAERVGRHTEPADLVMPTGPDRLMIVRPGLTAPAEAEGLALRIQAALATPMLVGEGRVRCQSAIGVAVSRKGDAADALLRYAEHAIGDARMLGGDLVVAFDDQDRELLLPTQPAF